MCKLSDSHKKQLILILTLLAIAVTSYGQVIPLSGVVNNTKGDPIQYVNIGVVGKSIGTVSDSLGRFKLFFEKDEHLDEILRFSSIGYASNEINVRKLDFDKKLVISLNESITTLNEIVIQENSSSIIKGKNKSSSKRVVNFALSNKDNKNLGAVIGRKFEFSSNARNSLYEFGFFIKENDFDYIKLRINLYSLKKGLPKKHINTVPLYLELEKAQKGWVYFDLSDAGIVVSNDIVVGVEWVERSNNGKTFSLPIIIPSIGSTHYYRYGSQDKWRKFRGITTPMIINYKTEK